ncbi:MAG TPA: hypothetical protein VH277_11045, partial [Gemmatimonadaceae bacterium]|nr:hypothetical protein [Gemmatimonadaceae bacterium]
MFQLDCAASNHPPRRPTRESGDGWPACVTGSGVTLDADFAQAAAAAAALANVRTTIRFFIDASEGSVMNWGRSVSQHLLHAIDLDGLIRLHVVGELENRFVLRGAVRLEQHVDHVDRAAVVLDHAEQEEAVELRPARAIE